MKTTDSKDLVKVNQILPIMQEYFGKSMNLARIKLMAYMLHALCVVQTVSLHKLAPIKGLTENGDRWHFYILFFYDLPRENR